MSWYTFSVSKVDLSRYDASVDLFSTLFLAKGMPDGMALWVASNFDTGENKLYAQIPDGMQVKDSAFFRTFPLGECAAPSAVGLSRLAGRRPGS